MKPAFWVVWVACVATALPALGNEAQLIEWPALRHGQPAVTTGELGGQTIQISGYLLPVDRDGDVVHEFMLVPWPGACSHMPQPPPDQMIHVLPTKAYRAAQSYEPVTVTGKLKAEEEQTQLFIMDGVRVVESGYSIGRAEVTPAALPQAGGSAANPWRFLKK